MAISIHTNYAGLVTQNTLSQTNDALTKSLERLATGYRINTAADDAAGLQIANRLETQSRGMTVAMRNAQDAISMMQTAEGAMDEMTEIAYRMSDLAIQGANGTTSADDLTAITGEYEALWAELNSILENSNFGGQKLLADTAGFNITGGIDFQVGISTGEVLTVDLKAKIKEIHTNVSALVTLTTATVPAPTTALTDAAGAQTAIGLVDKIISSLGAARAGFGANINRLEHTISNLGNMVENVDASKARVMETDFAAESGEMTKQQMLMQSGAQMLSASKMVPQLAMSMLG